MLNTEKLLRALLSKAYKLDKEAIDAMLAKTDEAEVETDLLDADKTRIQALKPKTGETFQDGYKKAKKEVLEALEAEVKEKFGVEADVTGLELIELVVKEKGTAPGKAAELTDDAVKAHPVYQALEKSKKTEVLAKETEWKTKLEAREKEITKGETFSKAKVKALTILDSLKPVLPTNASVAQNQKELFAERFKNYDFDFQENDTIVVMKDGKVVDDGHGNSKSFEDLVKETANSLFEFQNNNGGGNANNQETSPANAGAYPAGVTKPKTIEDLTKIMNDPALKLEDKAVVMEVYETENP